MYVVFLMGTGTNLRELRQAQNLGLRELARQVGVSHSHIMKIERGERDPSLALTKRLATVLRVDVGALFDSSDTEGE